MNLKETIDLICPYLSPALRERLLECEMNGAHKGGVAKSDELSKVISLELPYVEFPFKDIPSLKNIFTYVQSEETKPGLSPLHFGGGFYLLDPSSAFVPSQVEPGRTHKVVFDMCGAPGGKAIAYALAHPEDLVVSNEISSKRVIELAHNIERMGLKNVVVTSIDPLVMGIEFFDFFDIVLLDAPCSGSGMFIKEPKMLEDWSIEKVARCSAIQKGLIDVAYRILKDGGELLYSTCSYSQEEDDDNIEYALKSYPDLKVGKLPLEDMTCKTKYGGLLFPFMFKGEGQYVAKLIKGEYRDRASKEYSVGTYKLYGEEYEVHPLFNPVFSELHLVKPGYKIYDNREYAKSTYDHDYRYEANLDKLYIKKDDALLYMSGNELTLAKDSDKKEVVVVYEGLALGYGRIVGRKVKNLLPKGLYAKNIRL